MLARVKAHKSALELFQTNILLLTNAAFDTGCNRWYLIVCAGGENEFATFWRVGLWNATQQQHTKKMALFNVVQEQAMFSIH